VRRPSLRDRVKHFVPRKGPTRYAKMKAAIEKADTLIEALGWIRRFRGKTTVIKVGGSVLSDVDALHHLLLDILFMESVGMRPVVVHGGGARISQAMEQAGIAPRFVQGRRFTDQHSLAIVEKVLAEDTNAELARRFEFIGGLAKTLNFQSTPVLSGELLDLTDDDGSQIDLGFVGKVTGVNCEVIEELCNSGHVPFIPSMCVDSDGQKLNVNADTAATVVAQKLNAHKLVFVSDVPGVLRHPDDDSTSISSLTVHEANKLIADGVISGGMIPKIEGCIETVNQGVSKVHIVDGRLRHGLLLEVYTSSGIGTVISKG